MPLTDLPGCGECSTPTFDDTCSEELPHFFDDLELLLGQHNVVNKQECKQAALHYLSFQMETLWKTAESWADQTKSYQEFWEEIFKLYLGSSGDWTYTMQDLDLLLGHYAQVSILMSADLGEYHRKFLLIMWYLISKGHLSTLEQCQFFLRGLQPALEARINQHLQQKFLDHCPDDPYDLSTTYEAISFVLMGTSSTTLSQGPTPLNPTTPPPTSSQDPTSAKIEALTATISSLGEMFKTTIQTQPAGARPQPPAVTGMGVPGPSACNFCGGAGHYIQECKVVNKYICSRKCKCSPDGKVILASGVMVPRSITGAWLRDRIDEWHRLNPGQMATQMLFEVTVSATVPPNDAAGQSTCSCPAKHVDQPSGMMPLGIYALARQMRPCPEVIITSQLLHQSGCIGQGGDNGSTNNGREKLPHLEKDA